jgi:heme/copper-type cytochrome/quinol oxidase subunit 3
MGAPFFAMVGVHGLAVVMLYVGLSLSLLASCLYVRRGLRQVRTVHRGQGQASSSD